MVIATAVVPPDALANEICGFARALDVTQERAWADAMAFAHEEAGGLDILVNNAGIFAIGAIGSISLQEWRRIQAVNVEGVFLGCKHAVPLMSQRATQWVGGCSIINMSSVAALRGSPEFTAYAASKGAVRIMTKCLALEIAEHKIRVNSIHPGLIETEMGRQLVQDIARRHGSEDISPGARTNSDEPLAGAGKPENIADAILFLASDSAAFMTGAELVVDGGATG
ncbi:hypothetical protein ASE00_21180 [Sphingomonas sp. Root710]|nr:hypothetical protein ASE00_21180 [Sphingomonas sp. Root710]